MLALTAFQGAPRGQISITHIAALKADALMKAGCLARCVRATGKPLLGPAAPYAIDDLLPLPEDKLVTTLGRMLLAANLGIAAVGSYGVDASLLYAAREALAAFIIARKCTITTAPSRKYDVAVALIIEKGERALSEMDHLIDGFSDANPAYVTAFKACRAAIPTVQKPPDQEKS